MVEMLAPAGDFDCLKAAVLSGADAVYIGGKEFSARAFAGNFDRDEMVRAVRFCHSYGVLVYATMNTLYSNDELHEAVLYAAFLYENGVDALIVQDIGFIKLLREKLPDMVLHGSTQMTVHNLDAVQKLYDMGLKRVVLARELSLDEIKYIASNTKAEIEVFIHGALCISFSGQCLMSSMIGGRSGNRGKCAQSCRQEYKFEDGTKGYLLSPKDLSTLEFIKDIQNCGVTSLKIEGRMKKPEYVSGVVSAYKKALIDKVDDKDFDKVTQLFNRGGFTTFNLIKRQGNSMMSYKRPKNWGMKLGTVVKSNNKFTTIKLERELNKGDGVENFNRDNGAFASKIWRNGQEVEHADVNDIVEIYLEKAVKGDQIYKSLDTILVKNLEESYLGKDILQMPIIGEFTAKVDKKIKLSITDKNGNSVEVLGDVPQIAIKTSTNEDMVRKALTKTKDTPFYFKDIVVHLQDGIMVPVSEMNSLRRNCIEALEDKLQNKKEKADIKFDIRVEKKQVAPKLVCITGNIECAKAAIDCDCDIVFFGGDNLRISRSDINEVIEYSNGKCEIMPWIPEIVLEEYTSTLAFINDIKDDVNGFLCGNLGVLSQLQKLKKKVFLTAGFNIFNSVATRMFDNTIATVSKELNFKQIKGLIADTVQQTMVVVHGKTKVMVSRHCFIGSIQGNGKEGCPIICKNNSHYISDKMNESFQIIPDRYCRNHVYNSKVLCTIDVIKDILGMNADYLALEFVDESYTQAASIVRAYKKQLEAGINKRFDLVYESVELISSLKGKSTKGHFNRGVQ